MIWGGQGLVSEDTQEVQRDMGVDITIFHCRPLGIS